MIRPFQDARLHAAFNIQVVFQRIAKKTAVAPLAMDCGSRAEYFRQIGQATLGGGQLA